MEQAATEEREKKRRKTMTPMMPEDAANLWDDFVFGHADEVNEVFSKEEFTRLSEYELATKFLAEWTSRMQEWREGVKGK